MRPAQAYSFRYYPDMPVKGTLKLTELRLAQFNVDLTKQSMQISATAALVDPTTGSSAWYKCAGNTWGKSTVEKMKELMVAMEEDMARGVMDSIEPMDTSRSKPTAAQPVGLSEFLAGKDAPQM